MKLKISDFEKKKFKSGRIHKKIIMKWSYELNMQFYFFFARHTQIFKIFDRIPDLELFSKLINILHIHVIMMISDQKMIM